MSLQLLEVAPKNSADDWSQLAADMLATGRFRPERIMRQGALQKIYTEGRSVILPTLNNLERDGIIAHVARLPTRDRGWEEVSMAFVKGEYTRNGLLGQIVNKLLSRSPPDINFYAITKDIAMMKVLHYRKFIPVTATEEPHIKAWASALGISKRILPKTALLETPPDLDRIFENAKSEKKARRWLWKQTEQT